MLQIRMKILGFFTMLIQYLHINGRFWKNQNYSVRSASDRNIEFSPHFQLFFFFLISSCLTFFHDLGNKVHLASGQVIDFDV